MPTKPRRSTPLFFSTISCARRTSVRSISDADIRRVFSRSTICAFVLWVFMTEVEGRTEDDTREMQVEARLRMKALDLTASLLDSEAFRHEVQVWRLARRQANLGFQ